MHKEFYTVEHSSGYENTFTNLPDADKDAQRIYQLLGDEVFINGRRQVFAGPLE